MSTDVASPRSLPRGPALVFGALAALGTVVFLLGLGADADRTMRVFLHNWLLWAALAQGALVLSAAFRLTNATWPGPIQRVTESLGGWVVPSFALFFVIVLGRHHLFEWIHHPVEGKELWYNEAGLFLRDTLVLAWVTGMSLLYLYISLRPALGRARESATGWRRGLYARWTSGWRGEAAERDLGERRGRKISAVLALSYALGYSLLSVDLIMSLSPHWVSTMFPAYYSWGGFLSAVALTTVVCLVMSNGKDLSGEITETRRHDLGKMMFAFSIFWMYLFWSQYLVIWYGNIPEETEFIAARLGTQFMTADGFPTTVGYFAGFWSKLAEPYATPTIVAWFLLWVIPFWVLLGQRPKKTKAILGAVAFGSMFGFWMERYILVTPSLVSPEDVLHGHATTMFGWIELGVALGFIGLFFLSFQIFARVFPGALPEKS